MSNQESEYTLMDDFDVGEFIREFEGNATNYLDEVVYSDGVLNNEPFDTSSGLDEYWQNLNNHEGLPAFQNTADASDLLFDISEIQMDDCTILENVLSQSDQGLNNDPTDNNKNAAEIQEEMNMKPDKNYFALIDGTMSVKEQPKADQRARYASDGPRFLPDSKKHPMSLQLPDLSLVPVEENETFGIVVTMITSTNNPKYKPFVHVNGIIYRTEDAIDLGNGSIFIPLTKPEIKQCLKTFPRLSIICKKFDEYTFELKSFDPSTSERITEHYTIPNDGAIGKAAKGKHFTVDYDLLCYQIVFQLAIKQENKFTISHIKCETNLINEQKTATQGVKRKASSNDNTSKKQKTSNVLPVFNPPKKSKLPSVGCSINRASNARPRRVKGSSVDSS